MLPKPPPWPRILWKPSNVPTKRPDIGSFYKAIYYLEMNLSRHGYRKGLDVKEHVVKPLAATPGQWKDGILGDLATLKLGGTRNLEQKERTDPHAPQSALPKNQSHGGDANVKASFLPVAIQIQHLSVLATRSSM